MNYSFKAEVEELQGSQFGIWIHQGSHWYKSQRSNQILLKAQVHAQGLGVGFLRRGAAGRGGAREVTPWCPQPGQPRGHLLGRAELGAGGSTWLPATQIVFDFQPPSPLGKQKSVPIFSIKLA